VEFESDSLDVRNWVVDFGGLKPLKAQLEEWFDHAFLVAEDDPHKDEIVDLVKRTGVAKITFVEKTGCEGIAEFLYKYINTIYLPNVGEIDRVWCTKVEVRETDANMAMVIGERGDVE
jgi:6-pyruvoyltetrahydropterin/6-carboxytetrahydropterin synthase